MEALVESIDNRVSARDRIDAARVLAEAGVAAEPEGAAVLTREIAALSDAALERELDLFLRPDVERQVAAALRRLEAREAAVAAREAALDEREPASPRWAWRRRSAPSADRLAHRLTSR
jgi:hypothetical protein